jgi:uncharacterized protein YjiS (DUF1127 family)
MTDTDDELSQLLRDYRVLTPEQRDRLVRRVIERAKSERAAAIRNLFRRLWDWMKRRAAIAELQKYDDRMLRDIGIHRSEIEAAVTRSRGATGETLATLASCSARPANVKTAPAEIVGERSGRAA